MTPRPLVDDVRETTVVRPTSTGKRVLDLIVAGAVLAVTWPLLALIAVAIRLSDRGPALFRQTRIGLDGAPFTVFKFRTMVVGAGDAAHREMNTRELRGEDLSDLVDDGVFKLADDPRVTHVGRVLRPTSLDELPQLFNVLNGTMSVVGPRPALPWEVELYEPEHLDRLRVKPGITGLWQVSGRNRLSMREMLALDCEYARSWSVASDLKILLRTIPVVLRGDGAR